MSTIPFLVAAVIVFPTFVGIKAAQTGAIARSERRILFAYSVVMLVWVAFASVAGDRGWWVSESVQAILPGLWLPLVPVAVVMLPLLLPSVRNVVVRSGHALPWRWFAASQALRIAAIGTAIKTYRGEFPETVELLMGLPDLLFGISALWIFGLASRRRLSKRLWIVWNAIGFAIIVPFGMIVINMSLPGPFTVFTGSPSFLVALEFPLSLAPTAIVPWLVVFNQWAIVSALVPGDALDA